MTAHNLLKTKIKNKIDVLSSWEEANPLLLKGEIAFVYHFNDDPLDALDFRLKVGDGIHNFTDLPYVSQHYADKVLTACLNKIDTLSAYVNAHLSNDNIHVSVNEKEFWNSKAELSDCSSTTIRDWN